jgi:hypothetical protein
MSDWVAIPTGGAGTFNQGGFDPWWQAPQKQNSSNPAQAILWSCEDGAVYRTVDNGTNWVNVTTEIPDPPNTWDWVDAPTVADVTFLQRVDNIHVNKQHIFLVEMQDPITSDWGGWLLMTDNDGATGSWTWQPLAAVSADGSGNVYPSRFVSFTLSLGLGSQSIANTGAMLGSPDDAGAIYTNNSANSSRYYTIVDLGALLDTAGGAVTISVRHKNLLICSGASDHYGFHSAWNLHTSPDGIVWDRQTIKWAVTTGDGSAWMWGPVITVNPIQLPIRYIRLEAETAFPCGAGGIGEMGRIDAIEVVGLDVSQPAARPIWADVDTEDGSSFWLTLWRDDTLFLQKRNTSDLELIDEYNLGNCTIGELNARTYVAYPFTPTFDKDTCYVFGRMQDPQSLGNPSHLIRTIDGGSNFTLLEGGWGADVMNCFQAQGDTGGARLFHAVRNLNAGGSQFYYGNETLGYRSATPFGARGVNVDALTIGGAGRIGLGADGPGAVMIAYSDNGGQTWTDWTGSYPITGAVNSLVFL